MSLKIYEMAHSPYCIPITQSLTALGISYDRIPVPNWDRSEIIRLTQGAYYQVPVLVHDGHIIHESSDSSLDVAHYVDATFAQGRLFPAATAGVDAVLIEHIENELEGLTFRLCDIHYIPAIDDLVARTMVIRHKERRFGRGCVDAWRAQADDLRKEVTRLLGRLDTKLQSTSFVLQEAAPTYVDFALLGVVENLLHGGHEQLAPEHEALRSWHQRMLSFRY